MKIALSLISLLTCIAGVAAAAPCTKPTCPYGATAIETGTRDSRTSCPIYKCPPTAPNGANQPSGAKLALECAQAGCGAFPDMCPKVEFCIKNCLTPAVNAQNCFQRDPTLIDLARCKSLFPQCTAKKQSCQELGCSAYPPVCKNLKACFDEKCFVYGKADLEQNARNCYKGQYIPLDICKALANQSVCEQGTKVDQCADKGCMKMRVDAVLCQQYAYCINDCGAPKKYANDCLRLPENGAKKWLDLAACKRIYPQCAP